MKRLFLTTISLSFVITISSLYAELGIEQINIMVEKIQQKRKTKMDIDYKSVPTPFIIIKNDENSEINPIITTPTKKITFYLKAIINNSANINGKWYVVGDSIHEYKIIEITKRVVKLRKRKNEIQLFLPKKRLDIPQIKINEG